MYRNNLARTGHMILIFFMRSRISYDEEDVASVYIYIYI